eukprot:2790740-Rhodomonas_salina.1
MVKVETAQSSQHAEPEEGEKRGSDAEIRNRGSGTRTAGTRLLQLATVTAEKTPIFFSMLRCLARPQ